VIETSVNGQTIRSTEFWEDASCCVAGDANGLAYIEDGGSYVLFQTSGSTGQAKWIALRKEALLLSARAVNTWLDVDAGSVWGLALPIGHVGGFGVVARSYVAGCGFSEYEGKWDAVRFAEWMESKAVTHVSLVPTQVHDLLAAGLKGGPSLRAVVVGGGRLANEVGQVARDAGWPVLASFGMTEACSQVATQRMDSLDRLYADCPLELLPIWDLEQTEEGLLRLRGETLFAGTVEGGKYHVREGEWFTTSDRVAVSGRAIVPLGRADTMVKVMGELVDVEAVERHFMEVAAGRVPEGGFAVVALPDGRREHELVGVFEGEEVAVCVEDYNRQVPGTERIERWCVVAVFPRAELGKIRKGELREEVIDRS